MSTAIGALVASNAAELDVHVDAIERTIRGRGLNKTSARVMGGAGLLLAHLNHRTGIEGEKPLDIDMVMNQADMEQLAAEHGVEMLDDGRVLELPGDDDHLPVTVINAERNLLDLEGMLPKMIERSLYLPSLGIRIFRPSDIADWKMARGEPRDYVGLMAAQLRNPQREEGWLMSVEAAIRRDRRLGRTAITDPADWLVEVRANNYTDIQIEYEI